MLHNAGKATQLPKVSRKGESLPVSYLKGKDIFTIDGVLTVEEAQRLVEAAESRSFEHQGSRGPAFGEVRFLTCCSTWASHANT